jgi:malate dehydrogenase (oxaloacetate-decarboxylating)
MTESTGVQRLADAILNKGTAFDAEERSRLHLQGLLPLQVESLDQQVARAYRAYRRKEDDLERHINLRALQDTNEILFFRLLYDHMEEMLPIVYTPVVALGCQQFSQIYRRPRGLFVSYPLRDSIPALLRNRPQRDIDVIVVTDGERILGTGDQGVGGMGISIGKLTLYTLLGGIHPARTLPVVLDVGTNNRERLADPDYLGWRHERVGNEEYFAFIDLFVEAVKAELPQACLQWEDFATAHARPILDRYRDELLTFNDDIQGTAAVALGALMSGMRVGGRPLKDQTIVLLGAGSASIGVAQYLYSALRGAGLGDLEARDRLFIVDIHGILSDDRTDLSPEQRRFAKPKDRISGMARGGASVGLLDVVRSVEATVLVGLSTAAGAFTEEIVREMARKVERPIIFPLSNPTARSEAVPEDLIRWTDGRALVATGSPFAPVAWHGQAIAIAQCNNAYVFPAVGLGLVTSSARRVTDGMMTAAGLALAERSPALSNPMAPLLPAIKDLRAIAVEIAVAVGLQAQKEGVAPAASAEVLRTRAQEAQWTPGYSPTSPHE